MTGTIYFRGIKLDHVDVEKDLGILVSHNLSWNNHIDVISLKAQKMLNILNRTCKDINDIRTKRLLYIAWVRSCLEYASLVWSPHTKWNINNLEQVQCRATRFILGRDYSEYKHLSNCWRALARQLPILYNREKKVKSVWCKTEDTRSRLFFLYPGIPGCLWMHMEILIDFEQ